MTHVDNGNIPKSSNVRNSFRHFLLRHPYLNPYGFTTDRFVRNVSMHFRLLPDFLIIGYHKCGTTSLYNYLIQHPNIGKASRKEIQYFSMSFFRGDNWYRSHFPTMHTKKNIEIKTNEKFITGEATPQYIYHPLSLERIQKTLPGVKLILLLRNPIDRAYSHYMHQKRSGNEKIETFEEVIELDENRHKSMFENFKKNKIKEYNHKFFLPPYVSMGKYYLQVKKLLDTFSNKNILILELQELNDSPEEITNKTFNFLGVSNKKNLNYRKENVGKYDKINPNTRDKLIEFYKPYNFELEKLLGKKFDWNR